MFNNAAFIFQGVGSNYKKHIESLDTKDIEDLKYYSDIVKQELNLDLWNYLVNKCPDKIHDDLFCDWISIYTCDYMVYKKYISKGIEPKYFLGYSMGLVTALAAGESISFRTGLKILLDVYEYPINAKRTGEGMAIIIGLNLEQIEKLINDNDVLEDVEIGSENSQICIVISGMRDSVKKIIDASIAEGAIKAYFIEIPYAFHSSFAKKGIEKHIGFLNALEIKDCKYPLLSSLDNRMFQNSSEIREELINNIVTKMNWKSLIEKLSDMKVDNFVEVALNNSMSKLCKTINFDIRFLTYNKFKKKYKE